MNINNINMNNINIEEAREMIADYAKGKLSAADQKAFKSAIKEYPELKQELSDTIRVFRQIDRLDWNNTIAERTRNLSVKVNDRIAKSRTRKPFWSFGKPTFAFISAMVVLFVFVNRDYFVTDGGEEQNENITGIYSKVMYPDEYTIVVPHENMGILPEIISDKSFENLMDELNNDFYDESLALSEEINFEIDDMFGYLVFDDADINFEDYIFESTGNITSNVYDFISDFNEEEFNLLMENLADADFNS